MVGIGATDAHEFHLWGLRFAPYDIMFQMVRTHLLVPSTPLTPARVYEALRQGHAYLEITLVADAQRGVSFFAHDNQHVLGVMGDEIHLRPNLHLTTILPRPAHLTLFKDGQTIATASEKIWDVTVNEPGAYRLEASLNDKPWIFSNPIYIRPPEPQTPEPPAQESPVTSALDEH